MYAGENSVNSNKVRRSSE